MRNFIFFAVVLSLSLTVSWAYQAQAENAYERLGRAVAGDHRAKKDKARDKYRHPKQTLAFFGVTPTMSVVEIWPGRGWYTDVIAPYLKDTGKLYAAVHPKDIKNERIRKVVQQYEKKVKTKTDIYGDVTVTELGRKKTEIAPAGSADAVLTFRNVHNWMKHGYADVVFKAAFDALKPGGTFGVVEHRADPEEFPDPQALSGYVHESQVKELAKAAGFEFVRASDVNANPRDTRKHPKGVWTLPPTLRLGDKDKEKYLAIGESDRMTLLFRKPK